VSDKEEGGLLQVATKVTTPLSLVSLVVVVLYGLYKVVLGLPIFSVLPANSTLLLLNSIVDKVFYLAVIALVLGIVAYLWVQILKHRSSTKPSTPSEPKEDLRLVDLSIVESLPLPKLDFKLRNIGTQIAFLKGVEFKILDVEEIFSCDTYVVPITGALIIPSEIYDIELSPSLKGMSKSISVSHSLTPNDVDRFQFVLRQDWEYPRDREIECRWYYLEIRLIYNDTNRAIKSEPLLLMLKSSPPRNGSWTHAKRLPDKSCIAHNREVIRRMSKLKAVRSASVESAISEALGSKNEAGD
jgi:hypothetical protein